MRALGIFLISATIILFVVNGYFILHLSYYAADGWPRSDDALHSTAGVLVALFAGWAIFTLASLAALRVVPRWALFVAMISFVALVGLSWEFWEFAWDELVAIPYHSFLAQPSLVDTMSDLLDDIGGGVIGAIIFLAAIRKRRP